MRSRQNCTNSPGLVNCTTATGQACTCVTLHCCTCAHSHRDEKGRRVRVRARSARHRPRPIIRNGKPMKVRGDWAKCARRYDSRRATHESPAGEVAWVITLTSQEVRGSPCYRTQVGRAPADAGWLAPVGSQTFLLKPLCGAEWCETSFLLDD